MPAALRDRRPASPASCRGAGVHVFARRLRARARADPRARRHQPARGQAGDGLQPAVAAPARDRAPLVRRLPAVARAVGRAPARAEWQQFVNCLTTNLTAFFREDAPLRLPGARPARARSRATLRIWCTAASTGEEPYSIAMVVDETLGPAPRVEHRGQRHRHHGAGHRAARRLRGRRARPRRPQRLQRHFLRGKGANEGRIRVRPELARRVDVSRRST